ncbi:PREDICTED: far upstream element-binding protein 2-like [Nelumbo nucifera]|uniref:Far upstream element-binding protein 2-like n=1 Tax=Nelumbo nucifera TaxID=4432 RepID=A0A1U8BHN9_NELNU|nr:PREDICTED: far upstream element-binding protein 2-like [Nelumbo nucifera]
MAEEETQTDTSKRKLEEIQLAKQKAQEIVARLVNSAEAKRPRLDDTSDLPSSDDSLSHPPFSDPVQKPSGLVAGNSQIGSFPYASQPGQYHGFQGTSKKIEIPNGKVGVIIGKGGETIKYLQLQSGARIQVTKDAEADPYSQTRDVELMGTAEQISRAEQLIKDVIAETDAGGSGPSAIHGLSSVQPGAEQFMMKVPNNKVALIIGKGGETIKNMQSRSGARIQVVPLHLPPGDTSTERSVYINGTTEQIESAKVLINEIISDNRVKNPSMSGSYSQQTYRPPGSWGPQAPPPTQQPGYGYPQQGSYPTPPPYYGSYPQPATWDQTNPSGVSPPPQQNIGYNYYSQQTQTDSAPSNVNYGYGQTPPATTNSYEQGYTQQPQNYGQDTPTQGYGPPTAPSQLDGTAPSQPYGTPTSQPMPAYPVTYSQPPHAPPIGYGSSQSNAGPLPPQPGYNQAGFTTYSAAYGTQMTQLPPPAQIQPPTQAPPPTSQPAYGQGVYPPHGTSIQSSYPQGANPTVYAQPQPQPTTHGYSQQLSYGVERNADGNNAPSYSSAPPVQEAARPQS